MGDVMPKPLHFGAALLDRDVMVDGVAHKGEPQTWDYPGSPDYFEITSLQDEDTGEDVDVDSLSEADIDDIQSQAWVVLRMQEQAADYRV